MTKTGRIVSGIITLIGCGIYFVIVLGLYIFGYATEYTIPLVFSSIMFILGIAGGLLLFMDKTKIIGGILAIIAGGGIIIGSFIPIGIADYTLTFTWWFDSILILLGGIIGLVIAQREKA